MIIGIGTDICSVARITAIEKKYKKIFLDKFLSPEEISLSVKKDFYSFIAGRFAAKEAIQKAVSTKILTFNQITILNDDNGKPYLANQCEFFKLTGIPSSSKIHISISHEKKFAVAMVILEE